MAIEITTNNIPRQQIYGYELTEKERREFDYIDGIDTHDFFRYKGNVYDPGEFLYLRHPYWSFGSEIPEYWDGISHDSFFSGIVIKYVEDEIWAPGSLIVGRYISKG